MGWSVEKRKSFRDKIREKNGEKNRGKRATATQSIITTHYLGGGPNGCVLIESPVECHTRHDIFFNELQTPLDLILIGELFAHGVAGLRVVRVEEQLSHQSAEGRAIDVLS